jgi:2-dehydropantoate 2-reductase
MKILVYGAGAVGGYLAAKLTKAGHEVTVVVREVMADAIAADGLIFIEEGKPTRTHPNVVTAIAQAFLDEGTQYNLIIMTMKGYDLEAALNPLVAFCPNPPTLITVQNGIGVEQPVIDQYGAERVIAATWTIPISRETINRLKVERPGGGLLLAPIQPKQKIKNWVSLFKEAGITTDSMKDSVSMKWSSAMVTIVGNASSAIVNRPPDILYKSDTMYDLEVRMIQEALAVAKKHKIKIVDLPLAPASQLASGVKRLPKFLFKRFLTNEIVKARGDKLPSFYMDLSAAKRRNEVIFHNGAITRAGQKVGILTPVNLAYTDILMKLAQEKIDWREFDGRPQHLFNEVKRYAQQLKQKRATGK